MPIAATLHARLDSQPNLDVCLYAALLPRLNNNIPTIVSICGTSRPNNFTAKALAVVVDELDREDLSPTVFDARSLSHARRALARSNAARR